MNSSDCASTCSRIYSLALESASSLRPLDHRVSVEETLDPETSSYGLKPVDYCNWFFDGQPLPLRFGIGTMTLEPEAIVYSAVSDEKLHAATPSNRHAREGNIHGARGGTCYKPSGKMI